MAAPRMTQDDVGALYAGPGGSVWKLVGHASQPTATLERLERVEVAQTEGFTPCRTHGVVGSPIFDGFTRLVLDGGLAEQVARCAYPGCPAPVESLRVVGYLIPEPAVNKRVLACPDHVDWLRNDAGDNVVFDEAASV